MYAWRILSQHLACRSKESLGLKFPVWPAEHCGPGTRFHAIITNAKPSVSIIKKPGPETPHLLGLLYAISSPVCPQNKLYQSARLLSPSRIADRRLATTSCGAAVRTVSGSNSGQAASEQAKVPG